MRVPLLGHTYRSRSCGGFFFSFVLTRRCGYAHARRAAVACGGRWISTGRERGGAPELGGWGR